MGMRALLKIVLGGFALGLVLAPVARGAFPGNAGKVAFQTNRDGNFEIYTIPADLSPPTRLTNNPAEDVQPPWAADGQKIAFTSMRDGQYEVYTMNANGSGQTRITN